MNKSAKLGRPPLPESEVRAKSVTVKFTNEQHRTITREFGSAASWLYNMAVASLKRKERKDTK